MKQVLHVIQQLSSGGASRFLLSAARISAGRGDYRHSILSLLPSGPGAAARAAENGCDLVEAPSGADSDALVASADVVQVHYWNTPELFRWIDELRVPARIVLFCHVGGGVPPQAVTSDLLAWPDVFVANGPYTAGLPVVRGNVHRTPIAVIEAAADFARIEGVERRACQEFTVGTVGTIDFVKLHADFVSMSVAAGPGIRFLVCGGGAAVPMLQRQARDLGVAERFIWLAETDDIAAVFARLDVFGYPLCRDNYSSAELVLQEAMAAGVPPVVLPWGGAAHAIEDGRTGIRATTPEEYTSAILVLRDHSATRARMAAEGKAYARARWNLESSARRLDDLYQRVVDQPKRSRRFGAVPSTGAAAFVRAHGEAAPSHFRVSLSSCDVEATREADEAIAASSPLMRSATAGGILHYRRAYPRDPFLALWSGLVLEAEGRRLLAAAEYDRAVKLSCTSPHAAEYLRRSLAGLGSQPMETA